ncbi:MAG: hypothetical protein ACPHCX_06200 [Candidatus Puniceispirillaceae bacterium]
MKNQLTAAALISFAALCLLNGPVLAETRYEYVIGTVTDVETLTNSFTRKTPRNERICQIEDVPIYGESQGSSELGSMIIGGLIGSAVGNKLSDNNGAGSAGAVAGALLGRERAKQTAKAGDIVGYRQQEVCQTNRIVQEEVIEKIVGYRIKVEADGRILSLNASRPLSVGDRVEVNKKISYALN